MPVANDASGILVFEPGERAGDTGAAFEDLAQGEFVSEQRLIATTPRVVDDGEDRDPGVRSEQAESGAGVPQEDASGSPPPIDSGALHAEAGGAPEDHRHVATDGGSAARIGPYEVCARIDSGGMASVYLGVQRGMLGFQKQIALKCIHPHLVQDRMFTEMFVDEARIVARINHPFVCRVFDFGVAGNSYFMCMEFLEGRSLSRVYRELIRRPEILQSRLHCRVMARILANLAEGLHSAHSLRDERGQLLEVVHRDVTPHNLFVLFDGTVRVTDFGIARARQRLHRTMGHAIKGKLSYIAPEQLRQTQIDRRVDIWGLGVVAWELLTGRRLFKHDRDEKTALAILRQLIPRPSEYNPAVPPGLEAIVMRALSRDLSHRYGTARELSCELERFLATQREPTSHGEVASWLEQLFPGAEEHQRALVEAALRGQRVALSAFTVPDPSRSSTSFSQSMFEADARAEAKLGGSLEPRREGTPSRGSSSLSNLDSDPRAALPPTVRPPPRRQRGPSAESREAVTQPLRSMVQVEYADPRSLEHEDARSSEQVARRREPPRGPVAAPRPTGTGMTAAAPDRRSKSLPRASAHYSTAVAPHRADRRTGRLQQSEAFVQTKPVELPTSSLHNKLVFVAAMLCTVAATLTLAWLLRERDTARPVPAPVTARVAAGLVAPQPASAAVSTAVQVTPQAAAIGGPTSAHSPPAASRPEAPPAASHPDAAPAAKLP